MNAHVERFNRTTQEEFIDYHQKMLIMTSKVRPAATISPNEFNRQLIPCLLWYSAQRPHWALNLDSPVQFLLKEIPRCAKHGGPIQLIDRISHLVLMPYSPLLR